MDIDFNSITGSNNLEATNWTDLERAAAGDREALERLLKVYLNPLPVWAQLQFGLHPDCAEELAHEFVAQRMIEGDLLTRFDASRGRFRYFLRRAFLNFVSSQLGKDRNRQRLFRCAVDQGEFVATFVAADDDEIADTTWAHAVVGAVVDALRLDCERKGQPHLWKVFYGRLWYPLISGEPPRSFELLAESIGFRGPQQARLALWTVRKKFHNLCLRMLADECGDVELAQLQLEELSRILSRNSPQQDSLLRKLFLAYAREEDGALESLTAGSQKMASLLEKIAAGRPKDLPAISEEELVESSVSEFIRSGGGLDHVEEELKLAPVERLQSLLDLFTNPDTSLSALMLVKRVAHGLCDGRNPIYARELGLAIYYLCIAAVHVHCGRVAMLQASSLPQSERSKGFLWLASQDWMPTILRELVAKASVSPTTVTHN